MSEFFGHEVSREEIEAMLNAMEDPRMNLFWAIIEDGVKDETAKACVLLCDAVHTGAMDFSMMRQEHAAMSKAYEFVHSFRDRTKEMLKEEKESTKTE